MKTINKSKAIHFCQHWYGGQWSAIYQYLSSGIWVKENALLYVSELQENINNQEHAAKPYFLPKYQVKQLEQLISYFVRLAKDNGVIIEKSKHSFYGYPIYIVTYDNAGIKQPFYPI